MICRLLEIIELLDEVQKLLNAWPKYHNGGMAGSLSRISAELDMLGDSESGDVAAKAATKAIRLPFRPGQPDP